MYTIIFIPIEDICENYIIYIHNIIIFRINKITKYPLGFVINK